MVAETVPEKRRLEAGALLYTSAPIGHRSSRAFVNQSDRGHLVAGLARERRGDGCLRAACCRRRWRSVVRLFVREPERWKAVRERVAPPRLAELFTPDAPSGA